MEKPPCGVENNSGGPVMRDEFSKGVTSSNLKWAVHDYSGTDIVFPFIIGFIEGAGDIY